MNKLLITVTALMLLVSGSAHAALVGHWALDDGSGTTASDSSGNGNTGTLNGDTAWTTGHIGSGAAAFDGTGDYINVPDSASLAVSTGITVAFWVNFASNPGGQKPLVGQAASLSSTTGWSVSLLTTGGINASQGVTGGVGGNNKQLTSTGTAGTGSWQHIAYVGQISGGNLIMTIFINGIASGTQTVTATALADSTAALRLGNIQTTYYTGSLDDVRVYNNALSEAEIKALIPEPATVCLLGLGALALLRRRSA